MKKKSELFDGLMESLNQARDFAAGKKVEGVRITEFSIKPAREFKAQDIKRIRKHLHFTQEMLARFMEVSPATVRSWEQSLSSPLGPSRRLLEGLDRCAGDLMAAYEKIEVLRMPDSGAAKTGTDG